MHHVMDYVQDLMILPGPTCTPNLGIYLFFSSTAEMQKLLNSEAPLTDIFNTDGAKYILV